MAKLYPESPDKPTTTLVNTSASKILAMQKTMPAVDDIQFMNNYLKYFNDKVKKDGITDLDLDTGDGKYAEDSFNKYQKLNGSNYDYKTFVSKHQQYYNDIYNGGNKFAASLLKSNYPMSQLSAVDGRIGSYTRNYYTPSYSHADNTGVKVSGYVNPYSDSLELTNLQGVSDEQAQSIYKESGNKWLGNNPAVIETRDTNKVRLIKEANSNKIASNLIKLR
jgi:hypothetical protein